MENAAPLNPDTLSLLRCPLSHGPLLLDESGLKLVSKDARVTFPMIDGKPDLRPSSAKPAL